MITFSYLNLAEDNFPSFLSNTHAMDFILCRNVLMYFAPELTRRTINKFYGALVEGGWRRRSLLSQAFENNISRA
jgi:chemotaxis protein methyltransferase CheR